MVLRAGMLLTWASCFMTSFAFFHHSLDESLSSHIFWAVRTMWSWYSEASPTLHASVVSLSNGVPCAARLASTRATARSFNHGCVDLRARRVVNGIQVLATRSTVSVTHSTEKLEPRPPPARAGHSTSSDRCVLVPTISFLRELNDPPTAKVAPSI